jgi:phosphoglycerate dehydrogenase-like enzyme
MLALSLLRNLPKRIRATSWGTPSGISLFGQRITLVGAGGISLSLISLLEPFNVKVTVLRRKAEPLDPAAVPSSFKDGENLIVKSFKELHSVLPETDVLVIAAALTPDTRNMIGEKELALLPRNAVLVNVARGELVDTDALTAALRKGSFAGAGLDVTAPEPLPADHPLWSLQRDSGASFDKELEPDQKGNLIITPHTADTPDMIAPLLAARFARNAKALLDGQGAFEGLVDTVNGY